MTTSRKTKAPGANRAARCAADLAGADHAKKMVKEGHRNQRCNDPRQRCVQKDASRDCIVREALGGTKPTQKIYAFPLCDVDVNLLYESRRQKFVGGSKEKAEQGKG